jgi:hypothetical protein
MIFFVCKHSKIFMEQQTWCSLHNGSPRGEANMKRMIKQSRTLKWGCGTLGSFSRSDNDNKQVKASSESPLMFAMKCLCTYMLEICLRFIIARGSRLLTMQSLTRTHFQQQNNEVLKALIKALDMSLSVLHPQQSLNTNVDGKRFQFLLSHRKSQRKASIWLHAKVRYKSSVMTGGKFTNQIMLRQHEEATTSSTHSVERATSFPCFTFVWFPPDRMCHL